MYFSDGRLLLCLREPHNPGDSFVVSADNAMSAGFSSDPNEESKTIDS